MGDSSGNRLVGAVSRGTISFNLLKAFVGVFNDLEGIEYYGTGLARLSFVTNSADDT